jgi:hypothetical protein
MRLFQWARGRTIYQLFRHNRRRAKAYSLSCEPVVLEVSCSKSLHQTSSRRSLQHLCPDLKTVSTSSLVGDRRHTPASSGTKVIIIHSYFPPSLLSSLYAKLAGVFGVGNVDSSKATSSLKDPLTLTVVTCLNDSAHQPWPDPGGRQHTTINGEYQSSHVR